MAAPEHDLAKEKPHDLETNFNKNAPFGKEVAEETRKAAPTSVVMAHLKVGSANVRSLENYQEGIVITSHNEEFCNNFREGIGIMPESEIDRSAKTTDIANKTEKQADDGQALQSKKVDFEGMQNNHNEGF